MCIISHPRTIYFYFVAIFWNLYEYYFDPSTECAHMTTLSIPEQHTFIAFDLLYNRVHAWCGPGVDRAEI